MKNIKKYHIPFKGMVTYFKSFEPKGYKDGAGELLFGFWMAMYHACVIALPLGYILSYILY